MCIITLKFKRSFVTDEYLNVDICIFQYLCLPILIRHIIDYISIFILLSRAPTYGAVVSGVQGPGYFSGSLAGTNEFIYEILLGVLILILNNIIVMLKINTTSIIIYNYFIVIGTI